MSVKLKEESELVSTRLGPREAEVIDEFVEEGLFLNRADFIREAVREKLEAVEIREPQKISRDKAKNQIIAFLKEHRKAYPSDIADALDIEFDTVMAVLKGLENEGRVK